MLPFLSFIPKKLVNLNPEYRSKLLYVISLMNPTFFPEVAFFWPRRTSFHKLLICL